MRGALLLLLATPALASDLPPCHPYFPPGTECVMPELPPPGGILQDAPAGPIPPQGPLPVCSPDLAEGAICRWIKPDNAIDFEMVGVDPISWPPAAPVYTYKTRFLIGSAFSVVDGHVMKITPYSVRLSFDRNTRIDACTLPGNPFPFLDWGGWYDFRDDTPCNLED